MASILLKHVYKEYSHSKKEEKKMEKESISPFAVKDFNLEINDGEFIVLVGPSGCGKSTTLRMIAGLEDISGGELYIDDILSNNLDASKRNIAMVFQNYALYPHMNSYQNMAYGLKLRKISRPVLDKENKPVYIIDKPRIKEIEKQIKQSSSVDEIEQLNKELENLKNNPTLLKTKMVHYTKEEIDEKIQKAAEILDIKYLLDRKPAEMSGGQRQRVALGRALVRDPKVFLLDEPLSNLDAKLRASMRNEIVKLHNTVKTTFVYVTHDQVEAMTMGDRIVVMKDGVIQQVGTPSEIFDYPLNTFVAGFIGTPQMNFFDVDFKASSKDVEITLSNGTSFILPLKDFLPIKDRYIDGNNKKLILGIRGEHIKLEDKKGLDANVEFVEILGNSTNVLCRLKDSNNEFNITLQERSTLNIGDSIHISFEPKNIHLFDLETNRTIYQFDKEDIVEEIENEK